MIEISPYSPTPIYEQLSSQLRGLIQSGRLKKGESLPAIRSLANQLNIAINTVARAYQDLEREGLIISNGRKGSFVRDTRKNQKDANTKIFKSTIIDLLQQGLSRKDIEHIFHSNMNQIFN